MFDVNRRHNPFVGPESAAVRAFDADTAATLDDQVIYRHLCEDHATVLFDNAAKGFGKLSRAAPGYGPAAQLVEDCRVRRSSSVRIPARLR
ncbi:MAG: hypothetical protein AAFX10_10490, partial [Pseudomonadota bacterium]